MKTRHFLGLRLCLSALLACNLQPATAHAQGAQFFRISGPSATSIRAFLADGSLVWSNTLAGTNYTVQVTTSLNGGCNWVDYLQLSVSSGLSTNRILDPNPPAGMALIPAGSFQMGDNLDGDSNSPVHTVYVSGFYLDKYDVTYAFWQQVYNWAVAHGYTFDHAGSGKAANHPVQTIDWYDCVKWCNARSEKEGRTPAYYTDGTQSTVYRTGDIDLSNDSVNWVAGYRLPTEAEWEKAARGGLSGQRFPWGNTISRSQANYYAYPGSLGGCAYDLATDFGFDRRFYGVTGTYPFTSPVGSFPANGYGLYDMAGNMEQLCWDWLGTYADDSDPRGPMSGASRVARGGSYAAVAMGCRTEGRSFWQPAVNADIVGFRSALSSGE